MSGDLFVISAPSGAGKTTILKEVFSQLKRIAFSVSHTTRAPRPGEVDGKDYFFVDEKSFLTLQKSGGFLEWAKVHGNYYGTSNKAVTDQLEKGMDIVLDIDVQGAEQIATSSLSATSIFVVPPSYEELKRRLTDRNTDAPEKIKLRLENAIAEITKADIYDFIIVNDDLIEAVEIMKSIIIAKRASGRRGLNGEPFSLDLFSG